MMKTQTSTIFFLLFMAFAGINDVVAQESNEAALKTLLSNKTFVFKAQSAWPLQGTVVQLNPGFDMKLCSDSISTYLPYFGRSYMATYNGNGAINFTSTKFEYKLKEKSKGGWEITIKPTDARDITSLLYTVSTNGFATLQVMSANRQAISFYGVIDKK